MIAVRLLAALSLTCLPGVWLTCGKWGSGLPLTVRIAVAGVISPAVVVLEFFALRLCGVDSVGAIAWTLVAVNLLALGLLRGERLPRLRPRSAAEWLFVLMLLVACASVPWHVVGQLRMLHSHAWMHSAIIPEFQHGWLLPEEPELAGLRLAYPWVPHAYWATIGTLLNWAPTRVYVLTNTVSLLWTAMAVYAGGRAFGARGAASRTAVLWLALGTNVAGAVLWLVTGDLVGDIRYTPWLRKFTNFNDMPFALALVAALVTLVIHAVRRQHGRHAAVIAAVLCASGAVYPLTFPVVLSLAALVPVFLYLERRRSGAGTWRDIAAYSAAMVAATACTAIVVRITVVARTTAGFEVSSFEEIASKIVSGAIVLAPFLASALFLVLPSFSMRSFSSVRGLVARIEPKHILLLLPAAVTVLAAAVFHILGSAYNEYKLIMCAAVILAPFTAGAVDRLLAKGFPPSAAVVLSGLLLSPMVLFQDPPFGMLREASAPTVVEEGTSVHLAPDAAEAGWINVIRTSTPTQTVVIVKDSDVFVPAAAARSLYAPVVGKSFPGVNLESRNNLIELRGYSSSLVEQRLAVVQDLFATSDRSRTEAGWRELNKLQRPLAILAWTPQHDALLGFLAAQPRCRRLFQDNSGRVVSYCSP